MRAKNSRHLGWVPAALLAVAFLLAAGCGDGSGRPEGGSAGTPPPPAHPAMAGGSTAGGGGGSLPQGHPPLAGGEAGTGALPPGHPPLGGEGQGAGAGAASQEGPEVRIGPLSLTAPEGWLRRAPSNQFVLAEFGLPKAEGDAEDGRVTISSAGGSVEQNVARWESQFKEKPKAVTEDSSVSGLKVVTVRLAGTLSGGGGPMAKGGPDKPNSKMWGAVVTLPETNVFIKATGPQKTMERWDQSFGTFLNSLTVPSPPGPPEGAAQPRPRRPEGAAAK